MSPNSLRTVPTESFLQAQMDIKQIFRRVLGLVLFLTVLTGGLECCEIHLDRSKEREHFEKTIQAFLAVTVKEYGNVKRLVFLIILQVG